MKKQFFIFAAVLLMSFMLQGCNTTDNEPNRFPLSGNSEPIDSENHITEETAYEGVYKYCRSAYDWSAAENNPDSMYVAMGEESESEYQVIFRSYTGAFVYFYVDKSSGTTRVIECVPSLGIEEETGTINLYEYMS